MAAGQDNAGRQMGIWSVIKSAGQDNAGRQMGI